MTLDHALHDPNVISSVCALGVFMVIVLLWSAFVDRDPLPGRLKNVTARRDELIAAERDRAKSSRLKTVRRDDFIRNFVQKMKLEKGKQTAELRLKLARAGFRSRESLMIYLFVRFLSPIGFGVVGFFLLFVVPAFHITAMQRVLAFCVTLGFGTMLPNIIIKNQSQKRISILRKGMPDALDLMVICAEAGLSLDAALDRVSREIGLSCPELAEEIGLAGVELGFYPDRSRALQNLADRVPLQGVMSLVNTLIQTEKYGTPLAQALRVLSGEMRDERIMAAETKAAKLPATLTIPMIVFILPPLFIVLLGPAMMRAFGVVDRN